MSEHLSLTIQLQNIKGLHARAAAKFVKTSEMFQADIYVTKGTSKVSALSIMGLLMLVARYGTEITINAAGPEAKIALQALSDLINRKFDEEV